DGFRQSTAYILTAFGPYLVFSRVNWTKERLRTTTLAFVLPLLILSVVAVVEVVLSWHPYKSAVDNWDIFQRARYTFRTGFLRAYASVFDPIAFGLFLAAAIPMMLALISSSKRKLLAIGGLGALGVGLLATFSRGPWVGAALAVVAFVFTSDKPLKNLTRLGLVGTAGFLALSVSPIGDQIIGLLPFVGDSSTSSIDYRQQLMDIGWSVAMETKWFGSEDFMMHPAMQQLIQGQGIIDIVNSYLRVTLESGLVGLSLFVGVSFFSALTAYRAIGAARAIDPEIAIYSQAWLAALASVMLVIATTSSVVAQVSEVHWLLCGMCVGIARSIAAVRLKPQAPAPEEIPAAPTPARPAPASPSISAQKLPPHLRQYADKGK
ncbi:MAG: O-antigen ligase family protein, partial [Pseudomonadota bacterium]